MHDTHYTMAMTRISAHTVSYDYPCIAKAAPCSKLIEDSIVCVNMGGYMYSAEYRISTTPSVKLTEVNASVHDNGLSCDEMGLRL